MSDAISREGTSCWLEAMGYPKLAKAVMNKKRFPSVVPKKGKWIYHIDDLFPVESTMECNQCHAEQLLTCDDEFCPHCGAKMEVTE